MKNIWIAAVAAAVVGIGTWESAEAIEPARFSHRRPVETGAADGEKLLAVTLDADIFAHVRDGLPDLRLFRDGRLETPFQIQPAYEFRETRVRRTETPKVISLREENGAIEVRLELAERAPPVDGLILESPLKDYERKVRVYGSTDGKAADADWKLLLETVVYDYSRYMDVRNNETPLPANDARHLKVLIQDVTEERDSPFRQITSTLRDGQEAKRVEQWEVLRRPFRIDRIVAWRDERQHRVQQTRTTDYSPVRFAVRNDAEKKQTLIEVTTRREPLTRFTLETPARNFHRRATVEAPVVEAPGAGRRGPADRGAGDRGAGAAAVGETRWTEVGEATISRIGWKSSEKVQLSISFPEMRSETYRIVIHDQDNPPLEISGVKPEGPIYRLTFLAERNADYLLAYGSPSVEAPQYDAAAVLATLARDHAPIETPLGEPTKNPTVAEPAPPWIRSLLNNWIFLGGVIVLMVVVLGWTLVGAGRRVAELPPDER